MGRAGAWKNYEAKLKKAAGLARPLTPSPHEILKASSEFAPEDLQSRVEATRRVQDMLDRMKSCKGANDVFAEFARDAAMGKVIEMNMAESSDDRQRAQETVLDRALGKAVDRTMSIDVKLASMNEMEMIHEIRNLLISLGFASNDGEAGKIIDAVAGTAEPQKIGSVQAEFGIPGELRKEPEADPVPVRGKPVSSEGNAGDDIEGADTDREIESW